MNEAHFHLAVNHLPIIFPVVGLLVVLVGLISRSQAVVRTAYLIFIIGALTAAVAMASGEGAEEVIEKIISADSKHFIEIHEDAAKTFSIFAYILGAVSLAGLWASFKNASYTNLITVAVLLFSLVTLFLGAQTGTTGGEIRHTEIRKDNRNMPAVGGEREKEKSDD